METIKRPWCSALTCCWMPVEKVCFVYAIINAVICSLWTLASLVYTVLLLVVVAERETDSKFRYMEDSVLTAVILVSFVTSIVGLTFAVLLCIGLSKNKPCYVFAYVVYGTVTLTLNVLASLSTLGIVFTNTPSGDIAFPILAMMGTFGALAIYSGILMMVYKSYKVIAGRAPVVDHTRLHNDA